MPLPSGLSLSDWLTDHPQIRSFRIAVCDLNGLARAKRIPATHGPKLEKTPSRMPYSALNVDIWGQDIVDSPLVFDSGDADGMLHLTERGPVPMPWLDTPAALLPTWMFHEDGQPFAGDPRHALAAIQDRLKSQGHTPVIGVELEFYLVDDSQLETKGAISPPVTPGTGQRRRESDVLSLTQLDGYDAFFSDLYEACENMGIPADMATSEAGVAQFEITLLHQNNALKVADDMWLFKMLVRGLARKHGFAATFMAKPYEQDAGNGLHVHCSLLDADGQNIFDDGSETGSDALKHAVQGCLHALPDSALVFAPHGNSYARFMPGSHAPSAISWGYDNRTVALRVPAGPPKARRIEHRVAGGDANPYLLLAAILGAIETGLADEVLPPPPLTGNAYAQDLPQIPSDWGTGISAFEASNVMARIFPTDLISYFAMTKRQELNGMADKDKVAQLADYLDQL